MISEMRGKHGDLKRDPDAVAEVFANVYEELYCARCRGENGNRNEQCRNGDDVIQPFTTQEMKEAVGKLKSRKAADPNSIHAELFKEGGDILGQMILKLFNDILIEGANPPDAWRQTRLIIIFKKGNPQLPQNYRPIALIPIMYKLFSIMMCAIIAPTIYMHQSCDHAAYRPGFSTEDHLMTLTLLIEGCREWSAELFVGLVDFEKAFDSIEHGPYGTHCGPTELTIRTLMF